MHVKIKTLTPLWTGDIDGECNKIKETGIIGSLRWWYEALVRGLGGYACDITSNNSLEKCDYYRDKDRICDACRLFGCTGWSRRFRIETEYNEDNFENFLDYKCEKEFKIKIIELFSLSEMQKWGLWSILYIISKYGTIGAKNMLKPSNKPFYYDWGQVEIIWNESDFIKPVIEKQSIKESLHKPLFKKDYLPNLRYFIFSPEESLSSSQYWQLKKFDPFFYGKINPAKANKFASFKNQKRFWGYTTTNNGLYATTLEKLENLGLKNLVKGSDIIEKELFSSINGDEKNEL
jgi:CRISPR-associated protein Cmr1